MAVSYDHEALVDLFRRRETFAVELLTEALGVEVPPWTTVRLTEGDLGQVQPVEARADLVLLLDEAGTAVFGIIVEVQLGTDADKRLRWPLYAATLRVRYNCETAVLVVAPDPAVAAWASKPISTGPGNRFHVVVLGPETIPRIDGPDIPPELALLAVKAHAESEGGLAVVEAAVRRGMSLDASERGEYHDRLMAWLSPAIRAKVNQMFDELFPYPRSDFAKEHYGRGLVEGEATVVLRLLNRRFGELPAAIEERVRSADSEALLRWSDRLLDAETLDAVFADD